MNGARCEAIGCPRLAAPARAAAGVPVCGLCWRLATHRSRRVFNGFARKSREARACEMHGAAALHDIKAAAIGRRIVKEATEARVGLR